MANSFRSLFGINHRATFVSSPISHFGIFKNFKNFNNSIRTDPTLPLIIVSLGILLTASSGSWDITNHLLNRPETFFSPPHAGIYSGVVLVLFGSLMAYRYHLHRGRTSDINSGRKSLPVYLRLVLIGTGMLILAGPFDFAWHTAFGFDGLLSPSHAVLTTGMVLCGIGAFLGLISENNYCRIMISKISTRRRTNEDSYRSGALRSSLYIIISITAVWITVSGIIHMVSLPFSDTDYFKFNPNPVLAGLIATLCFPFLVSFILFTSWKLTNKFGVLSATGMIFVFINLTTAILPNENLVPTVPFYLINVIPIIIIDVLLSLPALGISLTQTQKKLVNLIAGTILGLIFFMLYFPLITHTYNEVSINPQMVWPSVTAPIYFGIINEIYPLLIFSSIAAGILGVLVSLKLSGNDFWLVPSYNRV